MKRHSRLHLIRFLQADTQTRLVFGLIGTQCAVCRLKTVGFYSLGSPAGGTGCSRGRPSRNRPYDRYRPPRRVTTCLRTTANRHYRGVTTLPGRTQVATIGVRSSARNDARSSEDLAQRCGRNQMASIGVPVLLEAWFYAPGPTGWTLAAGEISTSPTDRGWRGRSPARSETQRIRLDETRTKRRAANAPLNQTHS